MLISYPILPANAGNQTEQERFDAMLAMAETDRGLYPVTSGNRWHGGIHLNPGTEPIRAIADGVIVAYRLAPDTKDYPGQGAYDTSFVLIKHDTETGENTRVVYYSLYMHLQPKGLLSNAQREQLAPFLRNAATGDAAVQAPADTRIWRKEILGFGGQLYGRPTVHFEIFTTDGDFTFWRDRTAIAAGSHGSDDVFGDMHFIIPAGRQFAARHPRAVAPHRIDLPGADAFFDLPQGQAGQSADRLHVVVVLTTGSRTATTHRMDANGQVVGQVGDAVEQAGYEYELYRLATALYPDCPSAGFEYLRFGRVLGPDTTTRAENWQLVRYSDTGMGYIDLADPANQVSVLSDADFPMAWQKLDEGDAASATDGIANVERLTELLQLPADAPTTSLSAPAEFATRARGEESAKILRHFICKHPSEWDASDLDARYAELRKPGKALHGEEPWKAFKDHVEAMAFWPQSAISRRSIWHFHPLQFGRLFGRCGWLSESELTQCLPRRFIAEHHGTRTLYRSSITHANARTRTGRIRVQLNKMLRKHRADTRHRSSLFIANAITESSYLSQYHESGRGLGHRYGDWYGRGVIQLTHEENYLRYFSYLGRATGNQNQNIAWRSNIEDIDNHPYDVIESAGYWWSRNVANRTCSDPRPNVDWAVTVCENFDWRAKRCAGGSTQETRLSNPAIDSVARHINTGSPTTTFRMNGLPERRDVYINVQAILTDTLYRDPASQEVALAFPSFLVRQAR